MKTKNETQHTATPWHIGMKPGPFIYGGRGEEIARVNSILSPDTENGANARFIVRACNAHDDLVAALTVMIDAYDMDALIPKSDIRRFRAALAKAKGEQ